MILFASIEPENGTMLRGNPLKIAFEYFKRSNYLLNQLNFTLFLHKFTDDNFPYHALVKKIKIFSLLRIYRTW